MHYLRWNIFFKLYDVYNKMIQFKELVFIRSKGQGKQLKIEDIRNLVKKTMDWSFTSNRYDVY